jgi:hypothetical protein
MKVGSELFKEKNKKGRSMEPWNLRPFPLRIREALMLKNYTILPQCLHLIPGNKVYLITILKMVICGI